MYLNEAKDEREKADLALIIDEVLEQRYQGVKNEDGVWVTPAFPKLIYVLEEDNIHEGFQILLSDGESGTLYSKTYGAGLYFREKDEGIKRRQLLPGHGLPQRTQCVER